VKDNFWFYLLAAFITLVTGIQSFITYKRKSEKYNLVVLVTNIIIFVFIIVVYFTQWDFLNGIKNIGVKISIMIVIGVVLLASLFSRDIIQVIQKLKKKHANK
jgi:hypothetical protein